MDGDFDRPGGDGAGVEGEQISQEPEWVAAQVPAVVEEFALLGGVGEDAFRVQVEPERNGKAGYQVLGDTLADQL